MRSRLAAARLVSESELTSTKTGVNRKTITALRDCQGCGRRSRARRHVGANTCCAGGSLPVESRVGLILFTLFCHIPAVKNYLLTTLKIVFPIAIIAWLLTRIDADQLQQLRDRPKRWDLLAAAFVVATAAISVTFVRWYLLIKTLQLRFRLSDAFRLGFVGYLLNFVAFGAVGGDLFKAVFIAREQPGRRAEAVATVVVDRMVGLYALLLLTSAALLLSNIPNPTVALTAICNVTYLATGVGGIFVLMMLTPGFTRGAVSEMLASLPKVGPLCQRLINSVRMYRDKKPTMIAILGMSMGVHALLATSIYLIAIALFEQPPTLAEHCVIVPLSNVAGALPLMPAGLGQFEFAMAELYEYVPAAGPGDVVGILVALAYRLITIGVASIGMVYYWTSRAQVRDLMDEAKQSKPAAMPTPE